MLETNPTFILIGASSTVGQVFFNTYKDKTIVATRYKTKFNNFKKFNIIKDNLLKLLKSKKPSHLIFFSSISNVDQCFLDKKLSNKINYLIPKKIIKICLKYRITPVFFSTDYVFNGKKKYSNENFLSKPILEYGKQKKKLEDYILKNKLPVLILRMSRIFSEKKKVKNFLMNLLKLIKKNKNIFIDSKQFFSPVYINDAVKIIYVLSKKNKVGLYNIAGIERLSQFIIAKKIIKYFKLKKKIVPLSINKLNLLEKRPLEISMNINKVKKITNHKFNKISAVIKKLKIK